MPLTLGVILALGAGWCYAGSNVLIQLANRNRSRSEVALGAAFWSLLVNLLLYLVLYLMAGQGARSEPWTGMAAVLFALAGVATVAGRFLKFSSVPLLGATRAAAFRVLSPVYSVVVAIVLLGERPSITALYGAGAVLLGVVLMHPKTRPYSKPDPTKVESGAAEPGSRAWLPRAKSTLSSDQAAILVGGLGAGSGVNKGVPHLLLGYLFATGSALVFGTGDIFRKSGLEGASFPITAALIGSIAGLLVLSLYLTLSQRLEPILRAGWSDLRYFIGSGLLTGIAILSFFYSLQYLPLAIAAPLTCTEPAVNALISRFRHDEQRPLVMRNYLGLLSLLAGVFVVFQSV